MKQSRIFTSSALGRSIWTFRKEFLWVGIFSMIANILTLTPTLYMLQVFDRVMLSQSEFTLISLTLIAALFVGAMTFAELLRSRLLVRAGVRFDEHLNSRVFDASFQANLSGANSNKAFSDLTNLRQFLTGNGIFTFFDLPWTPIYLAVLFIMHPLLGWVGVGFTLFLAALAVVSHLLTAKLQERASDGEAEGTGYLTGKLRNAEIVEALGMLGHLRRRWLGIYTNQIHLRTAAYDTGQQIQAIAKFVQYSQQSLILALGAWLVIRGELSAGGMIASNALMSNALRPISTLVSTWKQFIEARLAFTRLEGMLDSYPEQENGYRSDTVEGQISLRKLVATAEARKTPILKGLDIEFEAGEIIGIIGPSGAGKSTLARCLIGIWPNVSGQVLLDGVDIRDWERNELGSQIGYLPQDIELFDGSVAENISRFGELDSDLVIEAARRTDIHDMILRLPMGYDTPMGIAGKMLSGGQRQRVGLARAVYGSPSLIVLDEPNANLDDLGEAALFKTIGELKRAGKTVFMVLHQRNLLALADRVLVLNDGNIAQFGKIAPGNATQIAQTRTA